MEISKKMILKSGCGRLREMVIGELKERRRRRQPGRQKSNRFITQNNNFARASRFLYISSPSLHDYDVKIESFRSEFITNL